MTFRRYSAVKQFGVPIDIDNARPAALDVEKLMRMYDIEPEEVPTESTDITPYYWQNPAFQYFASMAHPEGPAIVELLPRHTDSSNFVTRGRLVVATEVRQIEIPNQQEALAIVGPGPRFAGQLCIHEAIVYVD